MRLTRRGFAKFSAGAAMGLGVSGLTLKALSDINAALGEEIYPPRGVETFANSICQLCPGGCGIKIRKIGDRAVRVTGNGNSPVNRGGLCPLGLAATQYLYHPERVTTPLKKEDDGWRKLTWEQALEEIQARMKTLQEQDISNRTVCLAHPLTGALREITGQFLSGLGSDNLIELSGPDDGIQVALRLMQGVKGAPAYDLAHSNHVLSIGCEVLEGWNSPVWTMRSFAEFRAKRPRGQLTYVGPRRSVTASKADTWIRIRPGTEGAFALGVAYVLISERLYDFEFIRSHCTGFEDGRGPDGELTRGFRNLVLENYPLNRVSDLTGVPPEDILRVARAFGTARPAVALAGSIEPVSPGTVLGALGAHSLNALVGSIDRRGGILLQYPGPLEENPVNVESVPNFLADFGTQLHFGEDPLRAFEQALSQESKQTPVALFLMETDPLFDSYDPEALGRRLEQVPLIVSVSSFLNASSRLAHYVLPCSTFLESWVETTAPPGVWFSYEGLARPALDAAGESRSCGDIVLELGRALGIEMPEEGYGSLIRRRLARLYELRRGAVAGTVFDQLWHQLMEQAGWWAPTYETPNQLLEQMADKGGWWDSFYRYENWSRSLKTTSGKFQFHLPEILSLLSSDPTAEDSPDLPHHQPLVEQEPDLEYPFLVNFFDPLAAKSRQPALPLVREIAGGHSQNDVGLWLELGEEDAHHLGVRSGDLVWVESARKRLLAFARISPSVPAGVVNIPKGTSRASGEAWRIASLPTTRSIMPKRGNVESRGEQTRVRLARA